MSFFKVPDDVYNSINLDLFKATSTLFVLEKHLDCLLETKSNELGCVVTIAEILERVKVNMESITNGGLHNEKNV